MVDDEDGGGFVQEQHDRGAGFISGCDGCGCLSFCGAWFKIFGVALCEQCKRSEKLISKGSAKQTYLLTDGDLRKLGTVSKPNPQNAKWTAMQLYLQSQVEEVAQRKHGNIEQLEHERQQRLEARLQERLRKRSQQAAATGDLSGQDGGPGTSGAAPGQGRGDPHHGTSGCHVPIVTEAQRRVRSRLEAMHGDSSKSTGSGMSAAQAQAAGKHAASGHGALQEEDGDSGVEMERI